MTITATPPAFQTLANRPQGVTSTDAQPETPAHKKLRKAAQDFEGMLISQLWEHFQTSFASLGGETPMAGSDALNSLAIETLSTALAGRGGFGIGRMLVHQLEPTLTRGQR